MSRNNIRGPTSALSEFLRSEGITATTIAARRAQVNQAQEQPVPGLSSPIEVQEVVETEENSTTRRSSRRRARARFASEELDDPEEPVNVAEKDKGDNQEMPPAKKRKESKATAGKGKKKEKGKGQESDGDYTDEDDPYLALSRSLRNGGPQSKPPIGGFENCSICEERFTVTKYTRAANQGPGFLCYKCSKASGADPFKKPAPPKRRKSQGEKRTVTSFEERRFPSLVSVCIQLITKHINDIEALGDIGSMNVQAIAKALAKNRGLTPENALLFYNVSNVSLTVYDATSLPPPALESLAYLNPNLTSLRLDYCGHLDDASFRVINATLPSLVHLELFGPFLVRPDAWMGFFRSHPDLESFLITQSPRFDFDCVETLVQECKGLQKLRLKEVGKLDDAFLAEIQSLEDSLHYLDISDPTGSCCDEAVIELLSKVGKNLTHLNLSKHQALTDQFLHDGLLPYTKKISHLYLSQLLELTESGLTEFFDSWKSNPPLIAIDLSRNHTLSGKALTSVLEHSGARLEEFNINGCKEIDISSLQLIGQTALELRRLDAGWCREVDDFVIKTLLEGKEIEAGVISGGCKKLNELKVWGCNKVTECCPRRKGLSIYGVESHTIR